MCREWWRFFCTSARLQHPSQQRVSKQNNKLNGREMVPPPAVIEHRTDVPAVHYSSVIAHDWKRIALVTVAAIAIAWGLSAMQPARYRASSLASVAPLGDALQ